MIVLLLFPSIFPILHLLVFFPFPLLLFYKFFLISFFLSVLISSFSPSYLSSYHSSVRYPPLPSSPFFPTLSLSLSLLLFRVHAVLPLVLYHSSFTSSDILYFFLVRPSVLLFYLLCFLSFVFPLHLLLLCLPPFLLIIFSPLLPMYSTPSFPSTSSLVPLILRFPSHSPSALYYTPHFTILPLVLPLLPFPLPVMLRSSSPSSFISFLLSTILWFWFLLFSLLYPIILPHVQSVWSYYECPIPQQCCCLLFAKCMFC